MAANYVGELILAGQNEERILTEISRAEYGLNTQLANEYRRFEKELQKKWMKMYEPSLGLF